jgi:eukaryotic-like serine/threonine-protein kinase
MNEDGTGRQKVIREPVVQFQGVSPDGEWVLAQAAAPGSQARRGIFAYSVRDGSRIPICYGSCFPSWSPDGGTFLVALLGLTSSAERNTTFAIPLRARQIIPSLPPQGIKSEDDIRALKGFKVTEGMAYFLSDTSVYAYTRSSVHRNLYRIPVP